jgi:hypothetical protein
VFDLGAWVRNDRSVEGDIQPEGGENMFLLLFGAGRSEGESALRIQESGGEECIHIYIREKEGQGVEIRRRNWSARIK